MILRLLCRLPDRTLKVPLPTGEYILGAEAGCEPQVRHPTISGRHARLRVEDHRVEIEDLASANGTFVAGRRLQGPIRVEPGTLLAFGAVAAELQEIAEGDQEEAFRIGGGDPVPDAGPIRRVDLDESRMTRPRESKSREAGPRKDTSRETGSRETGSRETWSSAVHEGFFQAALPELLAQLDEGASVAEMAARVGAALWRHFPCQEVEIRPRDAAHASPVFIGRRDGELPPESTTVTEGDSQFEVCLTFWPPSLAPVYTPVAAIALRLLRLAGRRPAAKPCPRKPLKAPPLPAPETLHDSVRHIYERAARLAAGDVSVLVRGASGTGKEVFARYLHQASHRPAEQFIALNCAALPRDLLELELFGIEAGVATGVEARPGKFELAHGGTLFLDEVGDMALETQAKILRVLQEKSAYRIGGKRLRPAGVQVIAATNRDLQAMAREGTFRNDLLFRLAGWEVELPPLKRRRRDIPNLAAFFLGEEARKLGLSRIGISRSAMEALIAFDWPGNIRELQHEIRRGALLLADGELLETSHLRSAVARPAQPQPKTLKDALEREEARLIQAALQETEGHLEEAAKALGISRSTLYRRLRALGLNNQEGAGDRAPTNGSGG